jgi:hypothetical protein
VVQVLTAIDTGCDWTTVRRVLQYEMALGPLSTGGILRPSLGETGEIASTALVSLASLGCFLPEGALRRQLLAMGEKYAAFRLSRHPPQSDEFARDQLDTIGRVASPTAGPGGRLDFMGF